MHDNTSKKQDGVNSHIQMPKEVLKRFQNKYNLLCYYHVEGNYVGTKGTAESLNTEWGFYSIATEHYLRDTIETPFGVVLANIDSLDFNQSSVSVNPGFEETARNFICSLIARDPVIMREMGMEGNLLSFLPEQVQHDFMAVNGYNLMKRNGSFSDYFLTFLINETDVPFVLPIGGLYNYSYNGKSAINLPISPNLALCLLHKELADQMVQGEIIKMLSVSEPDMIMLMNKCAFRVQKQRGWGYVICPEREELDRLKSLYDEIE